MVKNYFKIALRNLVKYKLYTLINLLGLAIGMTACLLMLLYVQDELSYDRFHAKADRIFRITDLWSSGELSEDLSTVPFPVGRMLQIENPDAIEQVVRIHRPSSWGNPTVMMYQNESFVEKGVMFADSSFFKIFDFEFVRGSAESALKNPLSVVITRQIARKYFGSENPIGKTMRLNNQLDLNVSGVIEIPQNSHIKFDFLTTTGALRTWWDWNGFEENWIWQATWTYLLVKNSGVINSLREQMPNFVQRHFPESVKDGSVLSLQPLKDIHLRSQRFLEIETNGNIIYVYIFTAIALSILLIACINFMNLATARSANRAKEVGMRKVLGAYRTHLARQFLGESFLMSVLALILTIVLIEMALPFFNALTAKSLEINYFEDWIVISGLLGIGFLAGIMAGSYPAFYLSGFRPIQVLKGAMGGTKNPSLGAAKLRKVLVVSQFVVSLVLLICITIIYNQLNYLRNKDLGFNKEQVVYVDMYGNAFRDYVPIKNELLNSPDILAVTKIGGSVPGLADGIANAYRSEDMPPDKTRWIGSIFASHDIERVLGLSILNGRYFSTDFPTDSTEAFILNETAVKEFGWKLDNAVGKKVDRMRSDGTVRQSAKVIGVVKDFNYQPLHETLKPLVIRFGGGQFAIRLSKGRISSAMAHIKSVLAKLNPNWPVNYRFLDDDLDRLYRKEAKLEQIIQYFTVLAIFIACLGLFGLASFTTERRTKEIGVRKVLGASVANLVILLSKEFTKLVLIAFIIATPIAWLAMNRWLENFAFRISIHWWIFALAGSVSLLIALATVSYQAIKASLANPVKSLRYE